jgi:hypothetical protein
MLAVLALEALLGRKIHIHVYRVRDAGPSSAPAPAEPAVEELHQRTEFHSEAESTSFRAEGVVETADGRSITFSAELTMQRQFQSVSTFVGPAATDPLVVDLGGAPVQVTGAKIDFDLNSDGTPERISFVSSGSGLLALDRNQDGKVNDGSELFGPRSGDGFADLAAYDADGNGWIDESDPVFAKLLIWTRDGTRDVLSSLTDKGIGAISTSSVATPFALTDAANVLQAEVRGSGIYLREDGSAGTVQQVDLSTDSPAV